MPLDEPGQEITYTCDSGFEFVGDPVPATQTTPLTTTTTTTTTSTTTIAMDWKAFKGALYAKGEEDLTWQEARVKCQEAGGDLATIHTWEVHKFILDEWGHSFNAWIGLTDSETEGVYKWASGVPFEYHNWYPSCTAPQQDSNDCVTWESFVDGRWDEKNCDNPEKFFCQKGTSESQFWNSIRGAEYAHFERKSCFDRDRDESKVICESYGGDLARVLTQDTFDDIIAKFESGITGEFWIGLKKTSGTYKWTNGDDAVYTGWAFYAPNQGHDCVSIKKRGGNNGWTWTDKTCSTSSVDGVLCMKGNPEGPNGWIYTQIYSTNSNRRYQGGSKISEEQQTTGAECCQKCGEERADTKNIRFGHSDDKKCYCINELSPSTCTSTWGSCDSDEWVSGSCTLITNKKKRDVHRIHYDNKTNGIKSDIHLRKKEIISIYDKSHKEFLSTNTQTLPSREKRSVDTTSVRQISCQGIWSDTAGQWSYEYEVPKYCFSKMP